MPFGLLALLLQLTVGAVLFAAPVPIPSVIQDLRTSKEVQLTPNQPKAWVIVFLSARCPCSASHESVLNTLSKRFGPAEGFRWVGIHSNADEPVEEAAKHFEKLEFPIAQDTAATWADRLGALKTPHAFVLTSDGEVLYEGGVDDSASAPKAQKHFLANALSAIQEGKAPAEPRARALGCQIRRP